jgi:hypothetical protein
MDFTRYSTEELRRRLSFHEGDIGTVTIEQELRRLWLIQEIGAELARRSA